MAEISYPFESQNTGTTEAPIYDRAITAENEREFNKLRYVNGVFQTPANALQVTVAGGMKSSVAPGGAHLEGTMYYLDEVMQFTHAAANASYDRIDRIVLRFDTAMDVRGTHLYKLQGTPGSSPQPPAITQQANYYEIALADIKVRKGASEITNADITDLRLNSDLCGLVVPAIPLPLDLTAIYNQYQASLDQYLQFVAAAIDETLAGNLQSQIDALNTNKAAKVHKHAAADITSGTLPVARGGTGVDTVAELKELVGSDISQQTIQMFEDAGYPIE